MNLDEMMKGPLDPDLEAWVEDLPALGEYVRHPLVYGPTVMPGLLNAQYKTKKEAAEAARAAKHWDTYFALHERPYRLTMLWDRWADHEIDPVLLPALVLDFWMDTEFPHQFGDLPLRLFKEAGFITDDREKFDALPPVLRVYRGQAGTETLSSSTISWTLSRETALWFARRFSHPGTPAFLFTGSVARGDILGYITGRGEDEVVADPSTVKYTRLRATR